MVRTSLASANRYLLFIVIAVGAVPLDPSDIVLAECTIQASTQVSVETASQLCALQSLALPLNRVDDYAPLIRKAGHAQFVLLGDATHGTHEFYEERIKISKRLIQEKQFTLIGIEGDWANVQLLNQAIHATDSITPIQALNSFVEWPDWIWKNQEMLDFLQWLVEHNSRMVGRTRKVHLFGMDLYNFNRSQQLVRDYLKKVSREVGSLAERRYECFSRFQHNLHRYAAAIEKAPALSCEQAVTQQYIDFIDCRIPCPDETDVRTHEIFFQAQLNALTIKNAEKYFRILYQTDGDVMSWNARDRHMLESITAMQEHLGHPKTLLWAHSSHLGDAAATDRADLGELNLGQLLRAQYPTQVFSIGMVTYAGQVLASDDYYGPGQIKTLLPAQPESYSALFHQLGLPRFLLFLQDPLAVPKWLNGPRLQRHIGAVYRHDNERNVHYNYTHLVDQFDAIVHIDNTTPLVMVSEN